MKIHKFAQLNDWGFGEGRCWCITWASQSDKTSVTSAAKPKLQVCEYWSQGFFCLFRMGFSPIRTAALFNSHSQNYIFIIYFIYSSTRSLGCKHFSKLVLQALSDLNLHLKNEEPLNFGHLIHGDITSSVWICFPQESDKSEKLGFASFKHMHCFHHYRKIITQFYAHLQQ